MSEGRAGTGGQGGRGDSGVERGTHVDVLGVHAGAGLQQPADGVLRLPAVQGEDLLRAQVVHLEERVAVGQRLRAVAAEAAAQRGRGVLQRLHEVEGAQRHDAPQPGGRGRGRRGGARGGVGGGGRGRGVQLRGAPSARPALLQRGGVVAHADRIWRRRDQVRETQHVGANQSTAFTY